MCIAKPVGVGGKNLIADVRRLQLLLNLCGPRYGLATPLNPDGGFGARTLEALTAFQREVMPAAEPRQLVEPGDAVLAALKSAMPEGFAPEKLRAVMVAASANQIERYHRPLAAAMARAWRETLASNVRDRWARFRAIRSPWIRPCSASRCNTQANTAACTSSGSHERVLLSQEWSGTGSGKPRRRNSRSDRLSAQRHSRPPSLSIPSK